LSILTAGTLFGEVTGSVCFNNQFLSDLFV
jgi:hypothetical protein